MENPVQGKVLIFSAPSGSGKSTIIDFLMSQGLGLGLHFSISATSRPPRGKEQHGVEYFFLSTEEFKSHIEAGDFLEYEEVYSGRFYGTLRTQVDRQLLAGENVVCDVDVLGGKNIKKAYGNRALSIFIQPPSVEELRYRLEKRATDSAEVIAHRIERAAFELSFAKDFDVIIVNDDLEIAQQEALRIVKNFLTQK